MGWAREGKKKEVEEILRTGEEDGEREAVGLFPPPILPTIPLPLRLQNVNYFDIAQVATEFGELEVLEHVLRFSSSRPKGRMVYRGCGGKEEVARFFFDKIGVRTTLPPLIPRSNFLRILRIAKEMEKEKENDSERWDEADDEEEHGRMKSILQDPEFIWVELLSNPYKRFDEKELDSFLSLLHILPSGYRARYERDNTGLLADRLKCGDFVGAMWLQRKLSIHLGSGNNRLLNMFLSESGFVNSLCVGLGGWTFSLLYDVFEAAGETVVHGNVNVLNHLYQHSPKQNRCCSFFRPTIETALSFRPLVKLFFPPGRPMRSYPPWIDSDGVERKIYHRLTYSNEKPLYTLSALEYLLSKGALSHFTAEQVTHTLSRLVKEISTPRWGKSTVIPEALTIAVWFYEEFVGKECIEEAIGLVEKNVNECEELRAPLEWLRRYEARKEKEKARKREMKIERNEKQD